MKRYVSDFLDQWLKEPNRKPLVLRGARQVGKTWLVRDLAQRHGRKLIELNMERRPELADHFRSNNPRRALSDLSADLGLAISPETALLFIEKHTSSRRGVSGTRAAVTSARARVVC